MNDDADELLMGLERQLASMRPIGVPETLRERIATDLQTPPLTWSDRVMAGFMSLSAAAAIYIAVVVTGQMLEGPTGATPAPTWEAQQVDPVLRIDRDQRQWMLARQ